MFMKNYLVFLIVIASLLLSKDKADLKFNNDENYEDYIELFESSFNKL